MSQDNWGRWGAQDERGALNLVDPAAVRRGLQSVHQGVPISLGLPLRHGQGPVVPMRQPVQHFMTRDGGDYAAGLAESPGFGFADDTLSLACHGTTHLDALAHIWRDGLMWNGYPASTVSSRGAARCGIEKAGPVVTRGLFVDLAGTGPGLGAGEAVSPAHLEDAIGQRDAKVEPGDAVLVRTGWLKQWRAGTATVESWPGLGIDCASWLREHDVALIGCDNPAVEVSPSGVEGSVMPLHVAAMRDCGIHFLELLDLEALSAQGVTEMMLIVAPLNIVGGAASPCAPVAVV